jgi:hypothetical protein
MPLLSPHYFHAEEGDAIFIIAGFHTLLPPYCQPLAEFRLLFAISL